MKSRAKRTERGTDKGAERLNKSESRYFSTAERMDEALIECLEKKDLEYITVKEICEKAGVNRSTFYLHYETVGDLLSECAEYVNNKCFERYPSELADIRKRLASENPEDMIFISPEYLRPYFEFIRHNKRLFRVVLRHQDIFRTKSTFSSIFDSVFSPAMDKFHISEKEKSYTVRFYLGGITSVAADWLEKDCADPIDEIIKICMRCIIPPDPDF